MPKVSGVYFWSLDKSPNYWRNWYQKSFQSQNSSFFFHCFQLFCFFFLFLGDGKRQGEKPYPVSQPAKIFVLVSNIQCLYPTLLKIVCVRLLQWHSSLILSCVLAAPFQMQLPANVLVKQWRMTQSLVHLYPCWEPRRSFWLSASDLWALAIWPEDERYLCLSLLLSL